MTLGASCKVSIAFADGPLVASPTWTDVSAYVRSVSVSRGRSNELDDYQAGTCSVVFDNRDRRFDPLYSSGPYYGNLKVRRQVKVEGVVSGGSTYPIFRGLIGSYRQQWPGAGKDATCTIDASDLFTMLGNWELPPTAYELAIRSLSPTLWWRLDEDDASATEDLGSSEYLAYGAERTTADAIVPGGAGASRLAVTPVSLTEQIASGTLTSALASSTATTICGVAYVIDAGTNVRLLRLSDSSSNAVSVLLTGGCYKASIVQNSPAVGYTSGVTAANGLHHFALTRSSGTVTLYLDGAQDNTGASGATNAMSFTTVEVGYPQTASVPVDVTVSDIAVWESTALSSTNILLLSDAAFGFAGDSASERITRILDLLGVPSGLYSIGTASASVGLFVGATDALSYLQSAARTDLGRLFVSNDGKVTFQERTVSKSSVLTFADDTTASSVRYSGYEIGLDDRLVYNLVSVTGPGAQFTSSNTTSQSTYGPRSRSIDTAAANDAACQGIAETYVARYADPVNRGSALAVFPELPLNSSSTKGWASVLDLELADYVTVKRTPAVGSAISSTVEIVGIQHTITPGNWVVTFTGAPTFTDTPFVWGTSNWDGSETWS